MTPIPAKPTFEPPRFNTVILRDANQIRAVINLFTKAAYDRAQKNMPSLIETSRALRALQGKKWAKVQLDKFDVSSCFVAWSLSVAPLINDLHSLHSKALLALHLLECDMPDVPSVLALTAPECFHLTHAYGDLPVALLTDGKGNPVQPESFDVLVEVLFAMGLYADPRPHLPSAEKLDRYAVSIHLLKTVATANPAPPAPRDPPDDSDPEPPSGTTSFAA